MSEAMGRQQQPGWVGRMAWWRPPVRGPQAQPPTLGTVVGGYRLERRLGEGGQGTVYRARRGGRLYAIKLLSLASPQWAWRELEVRLRLRCVGELAVEGHGLWPHSAPSFLYLVTPYVRGRSLYAWAQWKNPTARQVACVVLAVARQLVKVHRAGVVHRDVKGANVLVRREDEQPVLVDFGVSTYVGAPEITHPWGLPGTRHYRSPEALRFRRERAGDHSPARASDDLWALGVLLYWLLTGGYPFDTDVADEGTLANVILQHEPEPPHACNPRVPRALSELCLRMLEKRFEARFADAGTLGTALEVVLAEADATWDVPLCEVWGPEGATTPQEEGLDWGDWQDKARRLVESARRYARRGRPLPFDEASTLARTPGAAAPGGSGASPAASPAPPPPRTGLLPRRTLALGALAVGLVGLFVLLRSPLSSSSERGSLVTSEVVSRPVMAEVTKSGQEVASTVEPPEGGRGAVPAARATTPAPVAPATPRKDGTRVRTPDLASTPRQQKQQRKQSPVFDTVGRTCTLVWVAGQLACASPEAQVRPPPDTRATPRAPPPEDCPPGSVETMKEVGGLRIGAKQNLLFIINGEPIFKIHTVRPGQEATLDAGEHWGKFPSHTLYMGQLLFGEGRVYGHFTRARTPDGRTFSVCLELYDIPNDERGVEMMPGSRPGAAIINFSVDLKAVKRFE
ncbi:serine/threonine protein kinase [Archangium sp.]|uniref:serine/threonine protein kinase n=1 Tax=Archangium sp. TaxID=1872627 RepID=UPI00389A91C8